MKGKICLWSWCNGRRFWAFSHQSGIGSVQLPVDYLSKPAAYLKMRNLSALEPLTGLFRRSDWLWRKFLKTTYGLTEVENLNACLSLCKWILKIMDFFFQYSWAVAAFWLTLSMSLVCKPTSSPTDVIQILCRTTSSFTHCTEPFKTPGLPWYLIHGNLYHRGNEDYLFIILCLLCCFYIEPFSFVYLYHSGP